MSSPSAGVGPNAWKRIDGTVTILLTLIGWSSVPLFINSFSHELDLWTSNGWRYGISALFWLPVVLWGLYRKTLPPRIWKLALVPAALNILAQIVFTAAHYEIDPGLLTFGLRSNIVFAALGAAIFFSAERAIIKTPGYLVGIGLVVAGTLGTLALGQTLPTDTTLTGVLLAIAAGAGFAFYALAVRHWMQGIDAIRAFAVISLYTALALVALMLINGQRLGADALALTPTRFFWLAVSALVGIALGHMFYYHSINRLGLAVSAGIVQLQPILVATASYFITGEVLTPAQWACGVIAITGAAVVLRSQHRAKVARRSVEAASNAESNTSSTPQSQPPPLDHPSQRASARDASMHAAPPFSASEPPSTNAPTSEAATQR